MLAPSIGEFLRKYEKFEACWVLTPGQAGAQHAAPLQRRKHCCAPRLVLGAAL